MKTEINQENKEKFFALYYGQKIVSHRSYPENSTNSISGGIIKQYSEKDYFLKLIPISKISDKDGLILYKIIYPMGWINNDVKYIRTWLESFYDGDHKKIQPQAVDFIRSIGASFEWMGLSVEEMIEAGWIKLIE